MYRSASVLAREADASLKTGNIRSALCIQAIRNAWRSSSAIQYAAAMLVVSDQNMLLAGVGGRLARCDPREPQQPFIYDPRP